MDALANLIRIAIAVSLALLVLAVGLEARPRDLLFVLRSPRRLIPALVAVNVIVPASAVLLVSLIPLPSPIRAGVLLMAVSPAPPLVPGKLVKLSGDKAYAYGLYLALILLAVVVVPISVEVVAWLISSEVSIRPLAAARNVALTALAPLALGEGVRALAPATARRLAPVIYRGALILLLLAILPILARTLPSVLELAGGGGFLAMAVVVLIALTGGAALAGPQPEHKAALAAAAATRHPGIALLIAKGDGESSQVTASVIAFLLISLLVAIPFQAILKRRTIGRFG